MFRHFSYADLLAPTGSWFLAKWFWIWRRKQTASTGDRHKKKQGSQSDRPPYSSYFCYIELRLFRANVRCVLPYVSSALRASATITRNWGIHRRTDKLSMNVLMTRRKRKWIGHILRKGNNYIASLAIQRNVLFQGDRRVGDPREYQCKRTASIRDVFCSLSSSKCWNFNLNLKGNWHALNLFPSTSENVAHISNPGLFFGSEQVMGHLFKHII